MCSGESGSRTHWVIHFLQLYYSEVIEIPSHLWLPGVHRRSAARGAWWPGCAQSAVSAAEEPWAVPGLGTLHCTRYFILKCLRAVMNYRAASARHCLVHAATIAYRTRSPDASAHRNASQGSSCTCRMCHGIQTTFLFSLCCP